METSTDPSPDPARPPRWRRVWRVVKWSVLGATLASALAAAGAAAWLLGTEAGARRVLRAAQERGFIDGYGEVRGRLAGPLEVDDLRVVLDPETKMEMERLRIDWQPTGLLSGEWRFRDVDIVHLSILATSTEPTAWDEVAEAVARASFDVRDLSIAPIDIDFGEGPHRIERFSMSVTSGFGRVAFRDLRVEHERGRLELRGAVGPAARLPIDLELDWQVNLPERPDVAGSGPVRGTFDRVAVDQQISAPLALRVHGAVIAPLTEPEVDLRVDVPETDWVAAVETLEIAYAMDMPRPLRASAQAELAGKLDGNASGPVRGTLRVDLVASPWGEATLESSFTRVADAAWHVEELVLEHAAGAHAAARGSLAWDPVAAPAFPAFAGTVRFDKVGWPLIDDPNGAKTVPPASGRVRVLASVEGARLEMEEARWLGGSVTGAVALAWTPALTWSAQLDARGLDPEPLAPQWSGSWNAVAGSRGTWQDDTLAAALDVETLSGAWLGQPLQLSGSASTDGTGLEVDAVEAAWGSATASVDGSVGESWDLAWKAEVADASELPLDLEGTAQLEGSVLGPRHDPRLDVRLTSPAVRWGEHEARRVDVSVEGSVVEHAASVGASVDGRQVQLAVLGGVREAETWQDLMTKPWTGQVETFAVTDDQLGTWRLAGPTPVEVAREAARLEPLCLQSEGSEVCVKATWDGEVPSWEAELDASLTDVRRAQPLLPKGLDVSGAVDVTGSALSEGGRLISVEVDATLEAGEGALELEETRTGIEHGGATLSFRADPKKASARGQLDLGKLGTVDARLELEGVDATEGVLDRLASRRLHGRVDAKVETLEFLDPLFDEVDDLEGNLEGQAELGGSLADLSIRGSLTLGHGKVHVAPLGVLFEDVTFEARAEGSGPIRLSGSARTGEGRIEASGTAHLFDTEERRASLRIQGDGVTIYQRPDATIVVDPDLDLSVTPEHIDVSGQVDVPRARFQLDERRAPAVPVSADAVVVAGERMAAEPTSPIPQALTSQILLTLGDDIRVQGRGLSARMTGVLYIEQTPGAAVPRADGEVRLVDGEYVTYGRTLQIRRGLIQFFGGPIDNPVLDVLAVRKAPDETLAGLQITGRVSSPTVELWSDPAMPDEQALEYLLFGRRVAMTSADTEQKDVVSRATTALGLSGGAYIARRLGGTLGFDQATIETGESLEDAALVFGKYLSPRLYVAYGVGLFESANSFKLQYTLSPRWSLEAKSSDESSADILYVIERPKPDDRDDR